MTRNREEPPAGINSDSGHTWFAVSTKPRQAHIALHNLDWQSYERYLPIAEKPYPRRRMPNQARHEPLFPRYLFLNVDQKPQSLAMVRVTRWVVSLAHAGVDLIRIPASIIEGLLTRGFFMWRQAGCRSTACLSKEGI